ncbi:hypothetical protein ACN6MY_03370 [Peribacillus sp. B-H-3]|uniref:hypothetical protein n=1 Tax=Peribacillus sp. B-H-3 TaxID=3400420 RepID=UPI003B021C34
MFFYLAVFVNFAAMEQGGDFRSRMLAFRWAGGGPPAGVSPSRSSKQEFRTLRSNQPHLIGDRITELIKKQPSLRKKPFIFALLKLDMDCDTMGIGT